MKDSNRIPSVLLATLVSGGIFAGTVLWLADAPRAQTPSAGTPSSSAAPLPGWLPETEIPFYAEWISSAHARRPSEAFHHWDKEGAIPTTCAKCHSTPGFLDYIGADGSAVGLVDRPAPIGTVITCIACHNTKALTLTSVVFPSGVKVDNLGSDARCMTCHQGVESTDSVSRAIAGIGDDTVDPKLAFLNVHYRAAGATLFGSIARGAYQYPGKTYAERFQHRAPYNRCGACHNVHTAEVKFTDCAACHKEVTDKASLRRIRVGTIDFDGNGNTNEGLAEEVEHLRVRLLAAIQAYAKTVAGKPIVYDIDVYPYFFIDTNGDGLANREEAKFPNKYDAWSPRLLKAAYNYQFVTKEPGAFAHNPTYTIQILYDSLADLGAKTPVDLSRLKRP